MHGQEAVCSQKIEPIFYLAMEGGVGLWRGLVMGGVSGRCLRGPGGGGRHLERHRRCGVDGGGGVGGDDGGYCQSPIPRSI